MIYVYVQVYICVYAATTTTKNRYKIDGLFDIDKDEDSAYMHLTDLYICITQQKNNTQQGRKAA